MNGTLQSVLHPAGADAAVVQQFAWVLFGAGTLIFFAVMALMALSLRDNARPLRPGLWIAGAGVAFPVLVLSALLVWSTWRSAQLVPQSSQAALSISVTAHMWWWEVRYRDPAGGREWMGFRPSLPDSVPVIGRAPGGRSVVYAFGHGHLGLTQAAATGRLIRELVLGQTPAIDLAPFSPLRF